MEGLSYDNIWKSLGITLVLVAIGMFLGRESEEARGIVGLAGVIFACLLLGFLDRRELRRMGRGD